MILAQLQVVVVVVEGALSGWVVTEAEVAEAEATIRQHCCSLRPSSAWWQK
jgi:hypothetical protein